MELVYLWVENYKNIHHQGFNFSPRFHCEYKNNELTICDRKKKECKNNNYIENFFGENINITAIVGKNGSGKSSVLKSFDFQHFMHKKSYYLYYIDGLFYSNYFDKEKNGKKIETSYNNIMIHTEKIYMNKLFFMQKPDNKFHDFMYESNLYIQQFEDKNKITLKKFHQNILRLIFQQKCLFNNFYSPKKIDIGYNLVSEELGFLEIELMKLLNEKYDNYQYFYKIYLKSLEAIKKYKTENIQEDNGYNLIEKELIDFIKKENILEYNYTVNELDMYNFNNQEIYNFLEEISHIKNTKLDIKQFYQQYLEDNVSNNNIFYYLTEIGFLEYELYDGDKNFSSLSSGEKSLFTDFCLLNNELMNKNFMMEGRDNKNFIILIDEPDLTLHPDWQKTYIRMIVAFLKNFKDLKFNLILTTHSPFLLSDIPKQNITFLDTYKENEDNNQKEGDCKVVDGLTQTFGANIHTLLSDSFFMKNGLMGEFAKNKIQEIMDFLNNKKKIEEISTKKQQIKQVIESIGEPFLRRKLLDMYYTKYKDESLKEARKKELLAQQKQIEEELKRL